MDHSAQAADAAVAGLVMRPDVGDLAKILGRYEVECRDKDGNLKWEDHIDNVITDVGVNDALDKYLSGSTWTTPTIYMGLKGAGTAVAADTMASHASWSELNVSSSSGARQSVTLAAASARAKATSAAVAWSITGSGTVAGCFIVISGSATNGNTTGVLLSAGDFSGGNRTVANGDTLNVSWSITLT